MTPELLAALVAAALPDEGLTAADLATACCGPGSEILGDADGALVLHVRPDWATAWIVLIAVDPAAQRRGVGRALVEQAATRAGAAGATELHLGAAVPRYVWPGCDYRFTSALALFESCGFEPTGAACNMDIATTFSTAPPPGVTVAREAGDAAMAGAVELCRGAYPHWEDEVARAIEGGTCFVARAGEGATVGFCCHSVNRAGWIGPMATDPRRRAGGIGAATLAAVCADLRATGRSTADIAWVGPIGFYAKCGAAVSRVFMNGRRRL